MFRWLHRILDRRYGKEGALIVRVTDKGKELKPLTLRAGDSLQVTVGANINYEGFDLPNGVVPLKKTVLLTVEKES